MSFTPQEAARKVAASVLRGSAEEELSAAKMQDMRGVSDSLVYIV